MLVILQKSKSHNKLLFNIILPRSFTIFLYTLTYMDQSIRIHLVSLAANILHDHPEDMVAWCKLEKLDPLDFPFGIMVLFVSLEV